MQYTLLKKFGVRVGSAIALAALASQAWAGPEEVVMKAQAAMAPEGKPPPVAEPAAAAPAATTQDRPVQGSLAQGSPDFGPPADLGQLEQSRGGTDVHNDMKLDGAVSGNSALNVVTGANTIDAGAFANMSGIPVVIQNSGANVLIQNATIVNLQFK